MSGAGTVGGLLTASGGATITGATSLNATGTATTAIGSYTGGAVSLRSGGPLALSGNGNATSLNLDANVLASTGSGNVYLSSGSGTVLLQSSGSSLKLNPDHSAELSADGGTLTLANTNNNGGVTLRSGMGPILLTTQNKLQMSGDNGTYIPYKLGAGAFSTATLSSTLQVNGSVALPLLTATSTVGLTDAHYTVRCATGCTRLVLPSASTCPGRVYVLINTQGNTSGDVTLTPSGTQTVSDDAIGTAITTLTRGSRLSIQSDGNNWFVLSR